MTQTSGVSSDWPSLKLKPLSQTMTAVRILDYVAGNVRSLANAIEHLGYEVEWVQSPEDVFTAEVPWNST